MSCTITSILAGTVNWPSSIPNGSAIPEMSSSAPEIDLRSLILDSRSGLLYDASMIDEPTRVDSGSIASSVFACG
jgi:hypothetical protein